MLLYVDIAAVCIVIYPCILLVTVVLIFIVF